MEGQREREREGEREGDRSGRGGWNRISSWLSQFVSVTAAQLRTVCGIVSVYSVMHDCLCVCMCVCVCVLLTMSPIIEFHGSLPSRACAYIVW